MAIYDIFDHVEKEKIEGLNPSSIAAHFSEMSLGGKQVNEKNDGNIFSMITVRLFFFILLIADCIYGVITVCMMSVLIILNLVTAFKIFSWKRYMLKKYLHLKRMIISFIALIVALFSPALGTMVACSYFLMYDRKGINEFVPTILQDQFNEFLSPDSDGG